MAVVDLSVSLGLLPLQKMRCMNGTRYGGFVVVGFHAPS